MEGVWMMDSSCSNVLVPLYFVIYYLYQVIEKPWRI